MFRIARGLFAFPILLVATLAAAHELLVLDSGTRNILRYSAEPVPVPGTNPPRWTHALIDTFSTITSGMPRRMAYHPDGRLFVSVGSGVEIRDGVSGALLDDFSIGLQGFGLAFGPGGHVFIADWMDHKVVEYDGNGQFIRQFTPEGDGLREPTEIAFAPNGDLWVASGRDTRIRRYQAGTGFYTGYATAPNFAVGSAQAIEFDTAQNLLYVSYGLGGVYVYDASTGAAVRNFTTGGGNEEGILLVPSHRLYAGMLYVCGGAGLVSVYDPPFEFPFAQGEIWLPPSGFPTTAQDIVFARRAVTDAPGRETQPRTLSLQRDGRRIHISYTLPEAAKVGLSVFDVRGRRVELLESGARSAGDHMATWDLGRGNLRTPAGVYFVELDLPRARRVEKVVVTP